MQAEAAQLKTALDIKQPDDAAAAAAWRRQVQALEQQLQQRQQQCKQQSQQQCKQLQQQQRMQQLQCKRQLKWWWQQRLQQTQQLNGRRTLTCSCTVPVLLFNELKRPCVQACA